MKPSIALALHREAVRQAAQRFRTANPRVFGSVVHGDDSDDSDLDLLVDPLPGATLFDLGGLQVELEEMLGVSVDLLTPGDLPPRLRVGACRGYAGISERRLPDCLDHMLEAARLICSYVADMSKDDFLADRLTQQAVILNLIIIGRAERSCSKITMIFSAILYVPSRNLKGMRNRIRMATSTSTSM